MAILATGVDGYIGWPVFLRLSKRYPDERIIGIDNLARRRWVEECAAVSAIPIKSITERMAIANKNGYKNITFIPGDLTDRDFVYEMLKLHKPHTILHMAAQPSAPYSNLDGVRASFTQFNNNQSTLNLLWGIKETGLIDTHFIETTTTGVYGAPEFEIPEGFFEVEYKGKRDRIPFPSMAGSWYHMSKCTDVNNMYLANKLFKLPITDIRTAIVYGTETDETAPEGLATRFDFDYYFGVVNNRFCAQVIAGFPLTIYGKGLQRKPMISLEDVVESSVRTVGFKNEHKYEVFNQTTRAEGIIDLANAIHNAGIKLGIEVEIKHVPNPRIEKEEHLMVISNERFMKYILGKSKMDLNAGIEQTLRSLLRFKETIIAYKDAFLPPELLKK